MNSTLYFVYVRTEDDRRTVETCFPQSKKVVYFRKMMSS